MMSKAAFVRQRPLDESFEQVIAAAKRAGIHNMTKADIYMARKALRNVRALEKVREAIGDKAREAPASEPEDIAERRHRRALVPTPGTATYRVHEWLDTYVRGHGRGPPNIDAVAAAVRMDHNTTRDILTILRRTKVIDYEFRDLRTLRVLRPPAKLLVPNVQGDAAPKPSEPAPQASGAADAPASWLSPQPESPGAVGAPRAPWPTEGFTPLVDELARLVGTMVLTGRTTNLEAKLAAIRVVLAIVRGEE